MAQTLLKDLGQVNVPSYPEMVMFWPGNMQREYFFPILTVRVFPEGLQRVVQHRKGYLVWLEPEATRLESKHLEYSPPSSPVRLTTWELRLLEAKLGSEQMQLVQNLTKRQLLNVSFLQQPKAVWSQLQVFTDSDVQYQSEEQSLDFSMLHPFWKPQLMNCPQVLEIDLYHPVSSNRARVMYDIVGLSSNTPAVMYQLQAALQDQCERAVPWPPRVYNGIPGASEQPYCSLIAF